MSYNYKRQTQDEDLISDHRISQFSSYGEIDLNQEKWLHYRLRQIFDRTTDHLEKIQLAVSHAKGMDLNHIMPDQQDEFRMKFVKREREKLLDTLSEEMASDTDHVEAVRHNILAITKPKPKNDQEQILSEIKNVESRRLLRRIENPDDRARLVEKGLDKGDTSFLKACIDSPDELLNSAHLKDIRMNYVFKNNPDLKDALVDSIAMRNKVREVCGFINGAAVVMTIKNELPEVISKERHFQCFPPRTNHEKNLADSLILKERLATEKAEKHKQWESTNQPAQTAGLTLDEARAL